MTKKRFLFMALMIAMLSSFSVRVLADPVDLNVGYVDPTGNEIGQQRGPITIPEVSIDDYTLSFITPCDGCTLRLLDENDNAVFTTIISSSTLVLPSTLSGDYRIEIISGNYCFAYHFQKQDAFHLFVVLLLLDCTTIIWKRKF